MDNITRLFGSVFILPVALMQIPAKQTRDIFKPVFNELFVQYHFLLRCHGKIVTVTNYLSADGNYRGPVWAG